MKKVIIDFTKWRSGSSDNLDQVTGKGPTYLLNDKGFMCCLGFGCQQLGGLPNTEIRELGIPGSTGKLIEPFTRISPIAGAIIDTEFSSNAIGINDSPEYTIAERMEKLIALHLENGIELTFINTPS